MPTSRKTQRVAKRATRKRKRTERKTAAKKRRVVRRSTRKAKVQKRRTSRKIGTNGEGALVQEGKQGGLFVWINGNKRYVTQAILTGTAAVIYGRLLYRKRHDLYKMYRRGVNRFHSKKSFAKWGKKTASFGDLAQPELAKANSSLTYYDKITTPINAK